MRYRANLVGRIGAAWIWNACVEMGDAGCPDVSNGRLYMYIASSHATMHSLG